MRIFTKRFLWIANIILAILLLCANAVPYINPSIFWPIGILGLVTPFIAAANLLFIVIWIFTKNFKHSLLSIIIIAMSWKIFSVGVAFNLPNKNIETSNKFKVMSYNVRLLNLYNWNEDKKTRDKLIAFLQQQQPDVLCLQEFFTGTDSGSLQNITTISKYCGYPYHATQVNSSGKRGIFGDIIFSKYPMSKKVTVHFNNESNKGFHHSDINVNGTVFRIFNLHLQSFKLSTSEVSSLDLKNNYNAKDLNKSKSILKKLRSGYDTRGMQAEEVANAITACNLPYIICGDFNDIPSSYSYFKIRGKAKDAFLDKSIGVGTTYDNISPTLRLDYIFFTPDKFNAIDYKKFNVPYSDHYPVMATFSIIK
jgi:endonuclease/exonuclease/phosphatase family metal-dependent hydrolase